MVSIMEQYNKGSDYYELLKEADKLLNMVEQIEVNHVCSNYESKILAFIRGDIRSMKEEFAARSR